MPSLLGGEKNVIRVFVWHDIPKLPCVRAVGAERDSFICADKLPTNVTVFSSSIIV